MFSSSPLFALLLAGVIQAAPATLSNTSTPAIESSTVFPQSTTISSGVPPAQSTTAPQNGTASAKFNGSSFTDVAPTINPNATLDAITKPGMRFPPSVFDNSAQLFNITKYMTVMKIASVTSGRKSRPVLELQSNQNILDHYRFLVSFDLMDELYNISVAH